MQKTLERNGSNEHIGGYGPPPELAIIIPTYNERENIQPLLTALLDSLDGIRWEGILVDDDSPDGTAQIIRNFSQRHSNIRCIHRIGRRGLSSAVIEGMLASSAPYVAIMDADLQHDEGLLPTMLEQLKASDLDIVIASRMIEGGSNESLGGPRRRISEYSNLLARRILGIEVRDLMSGFFMLRREVINSTAHKLSGVGFKILLDILSSSPEPLKFLELPYRFRSRHTGISKLDSNAAVALALTLLDKSLGKYLPTRLLAFLLVGGTGVVVHFLILAAALKLAGLSFFLAQGMATLLAMTSNFAINNLFTYRDVRLHGWKWIRGWFSFTLACSFGAVANVGVASAMYHEEFSWGLSALAGIIIGTAWNYGVTRFYTWQIK